MFKLDPAMLRKEFWIRKLDMRYADPSLFVTSQWCATVYYVAWTWFWSCWHVTLLILDLWSFGNVRWFLFLSNITYLVQTLGVVWDCAVTCYVYRTRKDIRDGSTTILPRYIQVQWVFYNLSINCSLLVTIVYYTMLVQVWTFTKTNKHLINSVYTLLSQAFCAKPVQILHCYQPMIYASMYVLVPVVYQSVTGIPLYPAFNMSYASSTGFKVITLILVGIPVLQIMCFSIYMLRLCICHRYCYKQGN